MCGEDASPASQAGYATQVAPEIEPDVRSFRASPVNVESNVAPTA